MENRQGPLAGYRVLEIGRYVTGPYAAQLLADLGAEVIKIEEPGSGDPFRGTPDEGYRPAFLAFNRNKRSLTLNLRHSGSREILIRLASQSDVFIENFRPGILDRLGLGYEALREENPRLVYCSITGLGSTGPSAEQPTYDIVGQGLSGLLSTMVDMEDPRPVGPAISDSLTGLFAAYGILAALQARERTGSGQRVETSLLQATMAFMNEPYSGYFATGRVPDSFSRPRASQVFAFTCSDGRALVFHLSLSDKFWRAFVTATGAQGLLEDERFQTYEGRRRNWETIHSELKPVFGARRRSEWLEIMHAAEVPVAPVHRLDEALEDPQVRHLRMVNAAHHPERGPVRMIGFPVHLQVTPLGPVSAPPTLGQHTDEILDAIGYSEDQIEAFRTAGTV